MEWYYARGDERFGPVSSDEFDDLVNSGAIDADTLVWREGLQEWIPYVQLTSAAAGGPTASPAVDGWRSLSAEAGEEIAPCAECGNYFPIEDLIRFQDDWVCSQCKPIYFQRIREGVPIHTTFSYAGFWIRFVAKFIDGLITGIIQTTISVAIGGGSFMPDPNASLAQSMFLMLVSMTIPIAYTTWFLGYFGATPGKMVFGLKVVRSDGSSITYTRAFARFFAEILSALPIYIGYIMAAFDEEKRALHDRVCDTRVVWTK